MDDARSITNRNIHRWSHSSSSSVSNIDTEAVKRRLQQPSRRMSIGIAPTINGLNSEIEAPNRPHSRQRSKDRRDPRQMSPRSKYSTEQLFSQRGRSPNASSTNLTPTSMFNTTTPDYFGETWQRKQNGKLGEPMAALSIHYKTTSTPKPRRVGDSPQEYPSSLPPPRAPPNPQQRPSGMPNVATQAVGANLAGMDQKKNRGHRSPTQKTMLSKALAKANQAVLLDNAQNIDGAIEAYAEACDLLQEVMLRSSDSDDRKKLSTIRGTYSNRIAELHDIDDPFANLMDKALPDDPPRDNTENGYFDATAGPSTTEVLEQVHIPPRQESLLPQIFGGDRYVEDSAPSVVRKPAPTQLNVPMETKYMPPPLSPRRPPSPSSATETITPATAQPELSHPTSAQRIRGDSTESVSWLNTVDDEESSRSSRFSSVDIGKSRSRGLMDEIEAEFDAALNAAVDAAYDDESSPEDTPRLEEKKQAKTLDLPLHPALSQDQAQISKTQNALQQLRANPTTQATHDHLDDDDETTEEEERLLDEMTQGYVFDDFRFDHKSKSALPRQSDSSSFTSRTFSSSIPSTTMTSGTTLSSLAETLEPPKPPPSKELPAPPRKNSETTVHSLSQSPTASPPRVDRSSGINLRDRRLSGHSARQLKIETFAPIRGTSQPPSRQPLSMPKIEIPPPQDQPTLPHTAPLPPGPLSTSTLATQPITPMTSVHSGDSLRSDSPATPALTQGGSQGSADDAHGAPASPSRIGKMMPPPPGGMRKNLSSSSLRMRNLSVTTSQTDDSPITPGSAVFPPDAKKGVPPLPISTVPTMTHQSTQSGGMYLFDDHIGVPLSPGLPHTPGAAASSGPPVPLEHCPDSFLLRPWWLMRCLYQALSHPHGGYVSTKLFIPRDIWRVKGVKLKMIDDKVAQCDLLTAALGKLAKVDNLDADAMWEELQSFETVLDQVRGILQKKLGSDVGLSSSANVFKSPADDIDATTPKSGSSNSTAKSFASSWRKLRSKSSNAIVGNSSSGGSKESNGNNISGGPTMSTLPMTTSTDVPSSRSYANRLRHPPPTPTQLTNVSSQFATYLSSLARLFDAVQILDNIARQVEDPGLKCSSKTLVGLELSVRNAAEFFAFFILRFVMADIGILIDKFLKRGVEWVLA